MSIVSLPHYPALALAACLSLFSFPAWAEQAPAAPEAVAEPAPPEASGGIVDGLETDYRGNARYRMRIEVPPGAHGMTPDLAIEYNSQLGNGIVGVRFGLGGLSSLRRCQATLAQNEYNASVTFTDTDRLCLDGEQLVAVDGAYWGSESVYYPERFAPTRVKARAEGGFVVQHSDGRTATYGATPDSRVALGNDPRAVRVWAVNEIEDLSGNRIEISYGGGPVGSGQFFPVKVVYGLNRNDPAPSTREVRLGYDFSRNDVDELCLKGFCVRQTARLISVETWLVELEGPGTASSERKVSRYDLSYETAPDSDRSRLVAVRHCGADGSCLPATTFSWQDGQLALASPSNLGTFQFRAPETLHEWADFDADGRPDLLVTTRQDAVTAWWMRSDDDGVSLRQTSLGNFACAGGAVHWRDFNGDGKTDLICTPNSGDGRHWVSLSTGTSLQPIQALGTLFCSGGDFGWTDINGDGRPDLTCDQHVAPFGHSAWINQGSGLGSRTELGRFGQSEWSYDWVDFNGDRMFDLVVHSNDTQPRHWVLLSSGDSLGSPNSLGTLGDRDSQFSWADINGDSLPDLIADRTLPPYTHTARINMADRLDHETVSLGQLPTQVPAGDNKVTGYTWRDFNNDGKADLLCCTETAGSQNWSVGLSRGKQTMRVQNLGGTRFAPAGAAVTWVDFHGTGLVDLLWTPTGDGGTVYRLAHQPSFPDLVVEIANGLGGRIAATYKPISDPEVSDGTGPVAFDWPIRALRGPLWVIASQHVNDGRINPRTYDFHYRYGGSRFDMSGRGWLGFGSVTTTDSQNALVTRSTWGQIYPLTGTRLRQDRMQGGADGAAPPLLDRKQAEVRVVERFPGVAQLLTTRETLTQWGSRGEDGPATTTTRESVFDEWGNEICVSDQGSSGLPSDRLSVCRQLRNVVDANTFVLSLVESEVSAERCEYDESARSFTCPDPLKQSRNTFSDDGRWLLTKREEWNDVDDTWLTTHLEYDAWGNITRTEQPSGGADTLAYDPVWRIFPITKTNALGHTTRAEWNPAFGKMVAEVDENGTRHEYRLDGFGRDHMTLGPDPDGRMRLVTQIERKTEVDSHGTVTTWSETRTREDWGEDDPQDWPATRVWLDGLGRTWRTENSAPGQSRSILTDHEYGNEAQLALVSVPYWSDEERLAVSFEYDTRGRQIRRTSPAGRAIEWSYEVVGNPRAAGGTVQKRLTVKGAGSAAERRVERFYDGRANLFREVFADATHADYLYGPLGELKEALANDSDVISQVHSSLGQVIRSSSPSSGTRHNTYWPNGLLKTSKDAAGNQQIWEWDVLARPITLTSRSADGSTTRITTLRYDQSGHGAGIGRLTSATVTANGQPVAEYAFDYDREGRKSAERVVLAGETYEKTYQYDAAGRLLTTTLPDGSTVRRQYDGYGFLTGLDVRLDGQDEFQRYVTYADFQADGKPRSTQYRNGMAVERTFNADGQVTSERVSLGGKLAEARRYEWNAVGDLVSIASPESGETIQSFSYGPQGYLIGATKPFAAGRWDYEYDAYGGMTRGGDWLYEMDGRKVVKASRDASGQIAIAYDAVGQPVSRNGGERDWTFRWDGEHHLIEADSGGQTARMTYGIDDHRVERRDLDGTVSRYPFPDFDIALLPDGTRLTTAYVIGPEGRKVSITRSTQPQQANTAAQPTFQPGPNGPGIPVAGQLFFASDRLGSVSFVSDESGKEISSLVYDPYGRVVIASSRGEDVFRSKWLDREQDSDTGFYNLSARYHDPLLNRFISPDDNAVGGTAENLAVLNRYAYGGNSPLVNRDPEGRFFLIDDIIEIGAVVAAAEAAAEVAAVSAEAVATGTVVTAGAEVVGAGAAAGVSGGTELAAASAATIGSASTIAATADTAGVVATSNLLGTGVAAGEAAGAAAAGLPEAGLGAEALAGGTATTAETLGGATAETELAATASSVEAASADATAGSAVEPALTETLSDGAGEAELVDSACNSSVPGTLIETQDGPRPVETLRLGDKVWAWDLNEEAPVPGVVTGIAVKTDSLVHQIVMGDGTLSVTSDHDLWVVGRGWTPASEVRAGDRLLAHGGEESAVTQVARREGPTPIHSLEIAGSHNYFAGGVLNHNVCYIRSYRGARGRVNRVYARVRPADLNTGTGTTRATRLFARTLGYPTDDAGHVIARALGGPGNDVRNIFPQLPRINRGAFRVWEAQIRNDIRATGRTATIRVDFNYRPNATRPYRVVYRYQLGRLSRVSYFGN